MDNKFFLSKSTCTEAEPTTFSHDNIAEAIRMVEGLDLAMPKYFYSEHLEPDDVYKMEPGPAMLFFPFDRNIKVVYICGSNIRDALIDQGAVFENYKPEEK